MKAFLLLLALLGLSLAAQPPAEVEASQRRIYDLMKQEFGHDDPPVNIEEVKIFDVEMRDGVKLRTRIWVPRNYVPGEKRSCILDRTPYGPFYTAMSLIWTFDGYVIVMQDQRGTFESEGNFEVWRKDGQDAYDTMEWISGQEWSNGKVLSFGVSADANSIYPQILYQNPWTAAHFPVFGVDNGHELAFPGGLYKQGLIEGWLRSVCVECIQDVRKNEQDGAYWDPINMTSHYDKVHFPSVHWAGWYDIFLHGQISAFEGYRKQAPPQYRDDAYLFIDPHGHCYGDPFIRGISLLGLRLGRKIFQLADTGVRDPLLDRVKHLTFWVMGPVDFSILNPGNYYTSLEDWPTPTPTTYYLSGSLALESRLPQQANLSYTYDPSDPPKTIGGNNLFGSCGPLDQAPVEARPDVLTFTTGSLFSPQALVGATKVVLFVSSSANDTDFLVKLSDVYPDGRSILLQEGVVRMKWREGVRVSPVLLEGEEAVYEVELDIWETAIIFARGHSIRISVASANHDRFHVNPNDGTLVAETPSGPGVRARNTLHVGGSFPSRVILPFVSESQIPKADFI